MCLRELGSVSALVKCKCCWRSWSTNKQTKHKKKLCRNASEIKSLDAQFCSLEPRSSAAGRRNHLTGMQGDLGADETLSTSVCDAAGPCGAAGPFPWWHQGVQKHCCDMHTPGLKTCRRWVERQNPRAAKAPVSASCFPESCSSASRALLGSALPAWLVLWAQSCRRGSDAVLGGTWGSGSHPRRDRSHLSCTHRQVSLPLAGPGKWRTGRDNHREIRSATCLAQGRASVTHRPSPCF